MNKHRLHFVVDLLAYLTLVGLAATGLLLAYRLPHGSGAATMLGLTRHEWGDVHFWLAIGLIALVALHVALHWRWVTNTFGALLAARAARRPGAGRGGTIALLVLGVATAAFLATPWLLGVEGAGALRGHWRGRRAGDAQAETAVPKPQDAPDAAAVEQAPKERGAGKGDGTGKGAGCGRGAGTGQGAGARSNDIRGNITLAEAAASQGVGLARLIAELQLPPDTPGAARLGPLRQEYGFTMEDVRRALARLAAAK